MRAAMAAPVHLCQSIGEPASKREAFGRESQVYLTGRLSRTKVEHGEVERDANSSE